MYKSICFLGLFLLLGCKDSKPVAYIPDSSGNLNAVTVVMPTTDWDGALGKAVREQMRPIYEGLPIDEPQYDLLYTSSSQFTGFSRHSRNILLFKKDSIARFQLFENAFARPQIVAQISGEDAEVMQEFLKENTSLILRTFAENERKEKLRRIGKSPTKDTDFKDKFGLQLTYPTAYTTVKDTVNFLWVEKKIQKGSMNLIAYTLPSFDPKKSTLLDHITNLRDSIGKVYIPGRLPGSHMITEKAYLPYIYSTQLDDRKAFLTKGMWEVKEDFMAGPFVQYIVEDTAQGRWVVLEGFCFAPSVSKRDAMFELQTILSSTTFLEK